MKAFLIAVIVLLAVGLLGWYTLGGSGDSVTVEAHPEKAAEDVKKAGEAIGDGVKKVKEETERVEVEVDVDRN